MSVLAAHVEALKLAHSTWVGYGPFYSAQEGVEIELTIMENTPLEMSALMAGQVDIAALTADDFPTDMRKGKQLKSILAVDNSDGGEWLIPVRPV